MFLTFDWSQNNTATAEANYSAPSQTTHDSPPSQAHEKTNVTTGIGMRTGRRLPAWRTQVIVSVEDIPTRGDEDEGTTWVVNERPDRSLARGIIVQYRANSITLGAGRLSKVTRLTRHWVSFKVHGVSPLTSVRVPMPWAQLSQIEQFEHVTRYAALPSAPAPSQSDSHMKASGNNDVTPYDFDIDPEDQYLERKLIFRNAWHSYAGKKSMGERPAWIASIPATITAHTRQEPMPPPEAESDERRWRWERVTTELEGKEGATKREHKM